MLQYAKQIAEAQSGAPVLDAVVAVPAYFGQVQRQGIVDAANLVGLNVLGLINTHTAAALQFGIERDFANKTQHVVFYDMGSGGTVAALVRYSSYAAKDSPGKPVSQLEASCVWGVCGGRLSAGWAGGGKAGRGPRSARQEPISQLEACVWWAGGGGGGGEGQPARVARGPTAHGSANAGVAPGRNERGTCAAGGWGRRAALSHPSDQPAILPAGVVRARARAGQGRGLGRRPGRQPAGRAAVGPLCKGLCRQAQAGPAGGAGQRAQHGQAQAAGKPSSR